MRTATTGSARRRWAVVAAAFVAVSGCADTGGDHAGKPGETPDLPTGRDTVIVQVETGGGLAGPRFDPWHLPELTVYGDGRTVVVAGRDGQAPRIGEGSMSRPALIDLFAATRDGGLLTAPGPDTGSICCDMAYTKVTLRTGSATHEVTVMGLGAERNDGLSDDQLRARQAVTDMMDRLRESAERAYAPEEVAADVFPSHDADAEAIRWPLRRSLADAGTPVGEDGRCLHVTNLGSGNAADQVLDAARDAARAGVWASAGSQWRVLFRPLLPHEHACPK